MNNSQYPLLIIENRLEDVDLAKRVFNRQRLFNPIHIARDGEEAVAYIERWEAGERPPALILLDLGLPKFSGLEVLRQFKSHPKISAIPVVVFTTSAEDQDVQEAYRLGCKSYIVKPVEFSKFMEIAAQVAVYWCDVNISQRWP